jgi:ATP-binding cassette, subfamily B, multidrug efflux pump
LTRAADGPAARRSPRTLFRCYRALAPYWPLAAGGYLAMLLGDLLALANPQLIRLIMDRGIGQRDFRLLTLLAGALLALSAVRGLMTFVQGRWLEKASQGVAYDLRNAIHAKLASLSFAFHDQAETGQLLSRSIQDVDRVRFLTGRATLRLVESVVMAAATAVALVAMSPRLALLSLCSIPILAGLALRFGSLQRRLSREIQDQLAVLTTRVEQSLRGVRIVKAFAQERAEIRRFEEENAKWFGLSLAAGRNQAVFGPLLIMVTNLAVALIIFYGGSLVVRKMLTIGELVAFSTYIGQLVGPVRMMGMVVPAIGQAVSCGERVFEILDARSEVEERPDAADIGRVAGRVDFQDVSFSYFNRYAVLKNVSFTALPGQVVALLGATGSGKSTIVNLIPRFYDATCGRILIDGNDVRSLTLSSLRGAIGVVLQETTLFAASVRQNILFGMEGADEERIIEAARKAQAHEFIIRMPQGYDTRIGEKGVTLSGGQKQRIAIARALLRNPPLLILDDATSSVDAETERCIQAAMETLMKDRTTFVIAHRLGTIRRADLILVLENGMIVARGSHDDLLHLSPLYADVYARQLSRGTEDA